MHQPQNMQIEIMNTYDKPISINWHGDSSSGISRRLFVIIRQSESRTLLKILGEASLLALLFMVLIAGVFCGAKIRRNNNDIALVKVNSIPLFVLEDLANERLWTIDDKTLIIIEEEQQQEQPPIIIEQVPWGTTVVSPLNTKQQDSIGNDTFTFSFTDCYSYYGGAIENFLDRTLKIGGVMAVQLTGDPSMTMTFKMPLNYKIVYFRKLNSSLTYIAMKKLAVSSSAALFQKRKKPLQQFLSEEKKAVVLSNLEDVLLEPPRSASGKSKTYLRKTKFLPNLLNDSLEGYSRRVYIDVAGYYGGNDSNNNESTSTRTRWFEQYYPTRNKHFDIYEIETVVVPETNVDESWEGPLRPPNTTTTTATATTTETQMMGISEWLWRNVKEEEFVVMKADAEVVEEMFKKKAITLVDELFLDCKPFGKRSRGGGITKRRPYWECLALYGRLRDFGVVVHQWWG